MIIRGPSRTQLIKLQLESADGLSHHHFHLLKSDLMGDACQKSRESKPNKIHTKINLIFCEVCNL